MTPIRLSALLLRFRAGSAPDLEAGYQEALHHEFDERGIPFRHQVEVPVFYKGQKLQTSYRTDFLCYESIVVELKAISKVGDLVLAQVLNYFASHWLSQDVAIQFRRQEP